MHSETKTIIDSQTDAGLEHSVASGKKLPADSQAPQVQMGEQTKPAREIGGPAGPEPTRYGDWQINGRCSDF